MGKMLQRGMGTEVHIRIPGSDAFESIQELWTWNTIIFAA